MLYLIDRLRDLICKFVKNPGYGWPHYVEETNIVEYMHFLCVKYHDLILSYTIVLLHHNFCALHMFLSETHTIILFSYWYGNRSMQWHVCNIVCKIRLCGAESHHNGVSYGVPQGTMCSLILIIYYGLHRTGGSEFENLLMILFKVFMILISTIRLKPIRQISAVVLIVLTLQINYW